MAVKCEVDLFCNFELHFPVPVVNNAKQNVELSFSKNICNQCDLKCEKCAISENNGFVNQ